MTADRVVAGNAAHGGFADAQAERLYHDHTALAERLARRYSFGSGVDDDLAQVARLALLLACRRFDHERGAFVKFATVTILGELKKHLRSNGWGVRVPRSLQEDSIAVTRALDDLAPELGRSPTVGEVAERTGFDRERVAEAIRVREARFSTSIEHSGIDVLGTDRAADPAMIRLALQRLPDESRRLIQYRFRDGLTQSEIGRMSGISQPQVHRRLAAAVDELRKELEDRT